MDQDQLTSAISAAASPPSDPLSDAAVDAVRAHPRFLAAVETLCRSAVDDHAARDPVTAWLTRDLGRASLFVAAVILDGWPGGVSVSALAESAAQTGVASRGRVLAWVQYAHAAGRVVVPPGPEPWVRRRLVLAPEFLEFMRVRFRHALSAAAAVLPDIDPTVPRLADDAVVRAMTGGLGLLLNLRPELASQQPTPRLLFLEREGGTLILQNLVLRQAPGRTRLLEAAALSRAELARRCGVSRVHLNKLIADGRAAGHLELPSPDRIVFSPQMSQDVERYFAGQFLILRLLAHALPPH